MGQMGQAFSNPNTFAADPSGFNGSEMAARFMGKGLQGGLQGLGQQPQRPQGGGYMPQFPTQQAAPIQFPGQDFKPSVGNNGATWPGDSQTGSRNTFYGVY